MVPSADGSFLKIAGKPLFARPSIEPLLPEEIREPEDSRTAVSQGPIRLQDVAGYEEVRRQIDELIIWPEKHRQHASSYVPLVGSPLLWPTRLREIAMGKGDRR